MQRQRGSSASSVVLLALALAATGCVGELDSGPEVPPVSNTIGPRGDGSFACTPGEAPSRTPLRRLSMLQYRNTLGDLLGDVSGLDVSGIAGPALARIPSDGGDTYAGMDDRLSDRHVQGFYDVADAVAGAATLADPVLVSLAGDCALSSPATATCIDAFLDDFAMRAYRRPLTAEERARYHAINDGTRDGRETFRALVFSILMAPQFLYHVEVDGTALGSETRLALDPYEMASRLSYHFWQSMPDDELLAAAADGSLMTDAGYEAEVRRIFMDPRTEATAETFYTEWLQIGAVTLRPSAAVTAMIDDAGLTGQEDAYLEAAADEVRELATHYTWRSPGNLEDLLRSNVSFTRSAELASIYGVTPWDGSSVPVTLPPERTGLLTRAAFLVSGNHTTHPIHRGFNVRHRLLCEDLVAPPATSLPEGSLVPPAQDPTVTTRTRFERKVASPQCATCHSRMNPIGYVLEQFDGLGRFRTEEIVYDEITGDVLNMLPIDSRSVPRISPTDDTEISTAAELTEMVAGSERLEACFAMNYFQFTTHRAETAADGCVLESVRTALVEGNLQEALLAIALDPSFRQRTVE